MSLTQTLIASGIGGLVTGGLAIFGVLLAAERAATAAAKADERRDAARKAADKRRDDAENLRWSRERLLGVYADWMADVEALRDQASDRAIRRRVMGSSAKGATQVSFLALRKAARSYGLLAVMASDDLRRTADQLSGSANALNTLSGESPLPEEDVIDEANARYFVAYHELLRAIRDDLDLVPPADSPQ